MSNLFRKEALENRSRALYGDVVLRGPLGSWVLTLLILLVVVLVAFGLFVLEVETADGPRKVIEFLRRGGKGT